MLLQHANNAKRFAPPPSQDRVNFTCPLFNGWKLIAPPISVWLIFQACVFKLPQNFLRPPFSMAKTHPPFSVGVKLDLPPHDPIL